jgi:hypothetical protein
MVQTILDDPINDQFEKRPPAPKPVVAAKKKRYKILPVTPIQPLPKRTKEEREAAKEAKRQKFVEEVTSFKCKLCGFLALTLPEVEQHLLHQHEEHWIDNDDWLEVAQR